MRQAIFFTNGEGMNSTQCRMARAALGWTLDDLSSACGISRRTIIRFEGGGTVAPESSESMRAALTKEGVAFENGGKRYGVSVLRRELN